MSQDEEDQREAEEASRLRPQVLHKVVEHEGEDELSRPTSALLWSALAAGLSMGFSLLGQALLRAPLGDGAWVPLISRLGYTLGFVLVILGRQQLFTEKTLTPVIPLFTAFSVGKLRSVARLWAAVLAGNLAGTLLFALALAQLHVFDASIESHLRSISVAATTGGVETIFVRAIFAGWLIALMVWILPSASSQLTVVAIITYVIGLAGLAHVIAGSVEAFYAALVHAIGWGQCIAFLVAAVLGNIVGGVALVAALGHAQVVSGTR